MATLISNKKSTYGSPYCYYTFTVSETSRTSSAVTLKFTVTAKLASSQSYIGTGHGLQAGVYIGGSWRNWTLKSTSESLEEWSGTAAHSKSASFSISAAADLNKFTGVKVRVRRTDSLGDACTLNATSAESVSVASSAVYTISYNANGGTGAPSAQTKKHGTKLTLSSTKPTRSSTSESETSTTFTFKGWGTSSGATTVEYNPGGTYSANKSATLYAIWTTETISSYDIVYVITDPKNDGFTQVNQEKKKGSSITIGSGISIPSVDGYSFKSWNTQDDGSGTTYANGATYSTDQHLILFSIWTPWTHTVTYNANGGSGAPSSFTKTAGTDVILSETVPTRSGYVFKCWNTASNGTGTNYFPGNVYKRDQNGGTVTLYAIWIEDCVLIYSSGNCSAPNFIENTALLGFSKGEEGLGCTVEAPEFIEGSGVSIKSNAMYFKEIIEK